VERMERIMSLVEEVRGILDLHEVSGMKKAHKASVMSRIAATHEKGNPKHGADAQSHAKKVMSKIKKGHAASTRHNPFKNLKKGKHLGGTSKAVARIKGPSTTTPGRKRGQWRCRCSHYHCICTGKGEENKGKVKHVEIKKQYKAGYNQRYKKWRQKHAKRFAAGKTFKAPKKPHHKGYESD